MWLTVTSLRIGPQEHYLKTQPTLTNQEEGPEKNLKHLQLLSKASDSISDGDLVDRMIHG